MRVLKFFFNQKLLLSLLLGVIVFSSFTGLAFAYDSVPDNPPIGWEYKKDVFDSALRSKEMNLESFVNETFRALIAAIEHTFFGGYETTAYVPGAIDSLAGLMISIYSTKPVSGISYLADLGNRIGLSSPAFAQGGGIGFSSLQPVMKMWKAFRNMAYALFAFAIVIVAFMVMFRIKVSPQVIVTIQTALPKIVFALILITFSYAIAGFVIDLIYVLIFAALSLFETEGLLGKVNITALNGLINTNLGSFSGAFFLRWLFEYTNVMFTGLAILILSLGSIKEAFANMISSMIVPDFGTSPLQELGNLAIGGLVKTFIGAPLAGIIRVIVIILVFFILFKIFWALLKSYIGILFSVIIAPFHILMGVFPTGEGFGSWFRGLLSNASTFVIVALMLTFSAVLMGRPPGGITIKIKLFGVSAVTLPLADIDLLGREANSGFISKATTPPLIGNYDANALRSLIGLGVLFFIPAIVAQVQALIKKPSGLQADIGVMRQAGAVLAGAAGAGLTSKAQYYGQMASGEGPKSQAALNRALQGLFNFAGGALGGKQR